MMAVPPERSLRAGDWGRVVLALFLALCLHAGWFLMDLSSPDVVVKPNLPQVLALTTQSGGDWSPTLFSLPSLTGFSGAMRDQSLQSAPPLGSPLQLTEAIRYQRTPTEITLSELEIPQSPFSMSVFSQVDPRPAPAAGFSQWRLTFPGHSVVEVEMSRLPEDTPQTSGFELNGIMVFDASGRVTSLVVHPPLPKDPVTPKAVQSLRRVRALSVHPDQQIRFRYTYKPVAGEAQ